MNNKELLGNIFEKGSLSLEKIINKVKLGNNINQSGSIFTFTGIVRETSLFSNKRVKTIEIEAWDEKASIELHQICLELIQDFNLIDARIYHAVGKIGIGEDLVYVVIASSHRKEGIAALEKAIDLYKSRAPVWKKEIYEDNSEEWISGKRKSTTQRNTT